MTAPRLVAVQRRHHHRDVDAVVSAANSSLLGGGGVDGAIHRAGPSWCSTAAPSVAARPARPKVTPGFGLRARWIIHTVRPVWRRPRRRAQLLASCYTRRWAGGRGQRRQHGVPAISTGIFGYPAGAARRDRRRDGGQASTGSRSPLRVCFDDVTLAIYDELLAARP
ncbi:MAG: macro domain-containing protein [Microthrixaceae bacterium]|nr:macro domain-containing protein [Microthrixaceae bacterium]